MGNVSVPAVEYERTAPAPVTPPASVPPAAAGFPDLRWLLAPSRLPAVPRLTYRPPPPQLSYPSPPPRLEYPPQPLLLTYPGAPPAPLPPSQVPAVPAVPRAPAVPPAPAAPATNVLYASSTGTAYNRQQFLRVSPAPANLSLFATPQGTARSEDELREGKKRLDYDLSGVFASRRELARKSTELGLTQVRIKIDPYAPLGTITRFDVEGIVQPAIAEKAWLDERLALLGPGRWTAVFGAHFLAANAKDAGWGGLKADWEAGKADWEALETAVKPASPPPGPLAGGLAARVNRLNRSYLKLIAYPRLKVLYGDKITHPGEGDKEIGGRHITPLRGELPAVFTEPDELYQEAYRDVALLMRSGEVKKATVQTWRGGTGGQRYLPSAGDLSHTDPADNSDWSYHLSVEFKAHPKSADWVRITKVHVTFRTDAAVAEPRYFWDVEHGDLVKAAQAGLGHRAWMLPRAKTLLNDNAKKIDCRPLT
jgi:hypothetical protein